MLESRLTVREEYFPGYAPHEAVFVEAAFKYELEHWEELHPDDR